MEIKGNLNMRLSSQETHASVRQSQLQAWQGATFFEGQNLTLKKVCKIISPNQEPVQPSFGTFF